jgi:hypothetical protein
MELRGSWAGAMAGGNYQDFSQLSRMEFSPCGEANARIHSSLEIG